MNIINPSTQMRTNPKEISSLETECLFGEEVEILDNYLDWVYCRLITDNYYGWIKKNSLGRFKKTTHRVIINRTFIYKDANEKSNTLLYLPMGSKLKIKKIKYGWAETCFYLCDKVEIGYVPSKHIVNNSYKAKDWVSTAQCLGGIPYRWGGRDTIGLDCSALLQLSYQTYGQNIPRNTSQQVNLEKKNISNINDLKRGCVIFFPGHVVIMIDKINCIHANAFHMKIVTEPLKVVIDRIGNDFKFIKMLDFN